MTEFDKNLWQWEKMTADVTYVFLTGYIVGFENLAGTHLSAELLQL